MGASTIYGTPVERDGVTVIPVAAARFGIGAGSGSDPSKRQEGEGGGGGGAITPAGYIELKDGRSRFVPIVHPGRMLALVCGAIVRPARAAFAGDAEAVLFITASPASAVAHTTAARCARSRASCACPAVPLDPRERRAAELDPLRLVALRQRLGGAQLLR